MSALLSDVDTVVIVVIVIVTIACK